MKKDWSWRFGGGGAGVPVAVGKGDTFWASGLCSPMKNSGRRWIPGGGVIGREMKNILHVVKSRDCKSTSLLCFEKCTLV